MKTLQIADDLSLPLDWMTLATVDALRAVVGKLAGVDPLP